MWQNHCSPQVNKSPDVQKVVKNQKQSTFDKFNQTSDASSNLYLLTYKNHRFKWAKVQLQIDHNLPYKAHSGTHKEPVFVKIQWGLRIRA